MAYVCGTRLLSFILIFAGLLISSKPVQAATSTYFICYSSDFTGASTWDWATVPDRKEYAKIDGFWVSSKQGESFFLSDKTTSDELKSICKATVEKQHGQSHRFNHFRASSSYFTVSDYPIRFVLTDKKQAFKVVKSKLTPSFFNAFLALLNSLSDQSQESVFASVVRDVIKDPNPKLHQYLHKFVEDAEKNTPQPQIKWSSADPEQRLKEFISLYKRASDYDILSYSLLSSNSGIDRSQFESYVSLVTTALRHLNPKLRTPQYTNLFELSEAAGILASVKGLVENPKINNPSIPDEELKELFSTFLGFSTTALNSLYALKHQIASPQEAIALNGLIERIKTSISECITE